MSNPKLTDTEMNLYVMTDAELSELIKQVNDDNNPASASYRNKLISVMATELLSLRQQVKDFRGISRELASCTNSGGLVKSGIYRKYQDLLKKYTEVK